MKLAVFGAFNKG